jgi:cytoskeletal protein CcmA (bactofilin family)
MANIVTDGEKFLGVSVNVDTEEKRSKYHNDRSGYWTIEDIVATTKEAGDLDVTGDMTVTGDLTVTGDGSTADLAVDGDATVSGVLNLQSVDAYGSGGAVDLTKSVHHIFTLTVATGTLAAGTEGQLIMFSMTGQTNQVNTMTITVANPSWGGAGTLLFNTAGDGCTLVYAGSKWNIVGNNGVTVA